MTERLYDDLAYLWPHLSPPEHYASEAESLREILRAQLGEPANGAKWSVLELGAGGGHTLHHLRDEFDCTAVDLSQPMLDNCMTLNPDVPCVAGDMRDVRLGRVFDAVLIHDAIDYMTTRADAQAAIATAYAHLRPGGLALIAPTYVSETLVDGDVADDGTTIPGIAGGHGCDLTYFTFVHDADPSDDVFEMILIYLIRDEQTRAVELVEDRHTCGLFAAADWIGMIESAGLSPIPEASSLLIEHDDEEEPAAWTLFVAQRGAD